MESEFPWNVSASIRMDGEKSKEKKKLGKSHDRISGPRSIDSFRKCPMEGAMHRKGALCHSKSDLMSLEKQVGVYIRPLLSVLFYGSHTANVASSKSPHGEKSSYWRGGQNSQLPTSSCLGGAGFTSLLLLLGPRAKAPHPLSISCWTWHLRMSGYAF